MCWRDVYKRQGLGLLFGNGAASYLSRLLGRGDKKTADQAASTALYSSISVGAAVILCSLLFLHPLLRQLGATESIMPYAITYTGIYIASSIFNVFNVTMNNIISSAVSYTHLLKRKHSGFFSQGINPFGCKSLLFMVNVPPFGFE